ncbi:MAG: hypothetical protein LBF71_00670 [Campylobacteraceae bacterium]|jgi:hypothetical protein|nr:hypothetical protein [Campylobacteraceae bacterium]
MNKINPLILISVLVLILTAAAFNVSRLKNEMGENGKALLALDDNAKKIAVSKKIWDKTNLKERLDAIFNAANISDKGKTFEVKISSLTRGQINDIVKKTLSGGFEIEKFAILAEAEDKISFTLEIAK